MAINIKYNDEVIFTITDMQLTILKTYINEDRLDQTIKDEMSYRLRDRIAGISSEFMNDWIKILQNDPEVTSVPVAPQDFVSLIIARPDYKTKKQKDEQPI